MRDKELYFLEEARELFEKDRANGNAAETAKEKIRRWQAERNLHNEDMDDMQMHADVLQDTQDLLTQSVPLSPSHDSFSSASRPLKLPSKGGKKRRITSDIIADELMEVTSSMKEIASAISTTNQVKLQWS